MATLIAVLTTVGVAAGATGGGTTAAIVGGVIIGSTVASIGVGIAGAVGAFTPEFPTAPTVKNTQQAADDRRDAVRRAQFAFGNRATQLTPVGDSAGELVLGVGREVLGGPL